MLIKSQMPKTGRVRFRMRSELREEIDLDCPATNRICIYSIHEKVRVSQSKDTLIETRMDRPLGGR